MCQNPNTVAPMCQNPSFPSLSTKSFYGMRRVIRGVEGAQKLADAIKQSHEVQQGLRHIRLIEAGTGEAGARALADYYYYYYY